MGTRQVINYNEIGIVNIETIEVPDFDIESQIKIKEDELLVVFEEIQRLKALKS